MTTAYCTYAEYRVAQTIFEHGYTNDQLAKVLNISPSCVKKHLFRLYEKLAVSSDRELLVWMRRNTLLIKDYQSDRRQRIAASCAKIQKLSGRGLTHQEIAEILDLNPHTVARYARKYKNAS